MFGHHMCVGYICIETMAVDEIEFNRREESEDGPAGW